MEEKTPLEIKEMIDSNPVLKIIDVREQWEFDKCHIERSTHIPMGKIPDSIDYFKDAGESERRVREKKSTCALGHGERTSVADRKSSSRPHSPRFGVQEEAEAKASIVFLVVDLPSS